MNNLSEKQASIVLDLLSTDHLQENNFKVIHSFEYSGVVFQGDYHSAVENFVRNNPNGGDFYVWLIDNRANH